MRHSIRLVALVVAALSVAASAQQPQNSAPLKFIVFVRAVPVGSDLATVTRGVDGWTISSSGSIGAPIDLVTRNLQIRYAADWKPLELTLDATVRGQAYGLHVTVNGTTAATHLNNAGQTLDKSRDHHSGHGLSSQSFLCGLRSGDTSFDDGGQRLDDSCVSGRNCSSRPPGRRVGNRSHPDRLATDRLRAARTPPW